MLAFRDNGSLLSHLDLPKTRAKPSHLSGDIKNIGDMGKNVSFRAIDGDVSNQPTKKRFYSVAVITSGSDRHHFVV